MHASAQTEMADVMRSNGKIYVVVVVLATIFAGIFAYLIMLERKISKLEKESKS
jgi:CcmD family protein